MLKARRRAVAAVIFVVLACISGASAEIAAQDTLTVAVGERVRVSTESGATHVGLLGAMTSGALEVQGEGGSQRFSVASVTRLDVSRGQKSRVGIGILVGAAAGALGAVIYCSGKKNEFSDEGRCVLFDDDTTPFQALIFGGLGGLVGGITGYFVKTEA